MVEQTADATTTTEATPVENITSVLTTSDQPVVSKDESVLDVAGTAEKAAVEAENKRLIESDPTKLNPEEAVKREGLVKQQEEVKAKALAEEKAKGVPEKYDIKAPEGVTLDQAKMDAATAVFKAEGLTNKQAQQMVNLFAAQTKLLNDESATNFKSFMENSAKETMEALGANAKSELAFVAKVKNILSPETIELLSASGMGNQKSFIMDLAKIGRMFSEEKNVDTGKGSAGGKSAADILYPNMKT